MANIELTPAHLFALKSALRNDFPKVKSSHLTEALAFALGFQTYAALKASMKQNEGNTLYKLISEDRFLERLYNFGYWYNLTYKLRFDYYDVEGLVPTGDLPPMASDPILAVDIEEYESKKNSAALKWLSLIDSGEYELAWTSATRYFQLKVSLDELKNTVIMRKKSMGSLLSRKPLGLFYPTYNRYLNLTDMGGIQFEVEYESGLVLETLNLAVESDLKVMAYRSDSMDYPPNSLSSSLLKKMI